MDQTKGALKKLMDRKTKVKNKKLQTQREYHMLSIKLFSKATSIIKPPEIEYKDDNDIIERQSFHDSVQIIEYKKKLTEEKCKEAIKLFQNNKRNLSQNQFFIQYLMQLEPFNQIISESASSEAEDIIRLLSFTLKYNFSPKGTPIFKFGEYSNMFYLILNGQVDIMVPNEEEIELTEEEYFLYLLKLRQYNEHHLLNKALVKNCNVYCLEEKIFDNWVKIAYNTLSSIKSAQTQLQMIRNENEHDDTFINHATTFSRPIKTLSNSPTRGQSRLSQIKFSPDKLTHSNKIPSPRFSPKKRRKQSIVQQDPNSKKQIFDSNERRELILSLDSDIINTMKIIDPYFEDEFLLDKTFESNQQMCSTEEYINRTKPIKMNNDFYVKKKKVIISSYFLANRMYTGDKFGEMMNDVNQINSNNQRVSTIITAKDCEFGILDKEGYNKCLKDAYERIRKIKLNFLLQIQIFIKCNKSLFMRSFSNFFTKRTFQSKETLFNENAVQEDIMSVYFIRDGEFVAEWNKSLNDINYIINTLNYNWLLPSDDESKPNLSLENFMKKRIHWKLQYFTENDVIGLNDALINKKYLYTVKCSSSQGTVYEIHLSFLKMVIALDPLIAENVKNYEIIRRNLMIKLLSKQKKQKLETFKKINTNIFENEFTYVKKGVIMAKKIHTTINRNCKRKHIIAFNKKRVNSSKEGSKNQDNNTSNTLNQISNNKYTHFANTISNITCSNKENNLKINTHQIQLKNCFIKNDTIKLNSNKVHFNSISKTKDYYKTTLESETIQKRHNKNKSSTEFIFPIPKESTTKEISRLNFNLSYNRHLTQRENTKLELIFYSLSKSIYKYNKNSHHYSRIKPQIYLNQK